MWHLRARQHPVDRGQAAGGVLGALSGRRSGEAHLWLLFEEAVATARREADADPAAWEARRSFRAACDALVAVGGVAPVIADAMTGELEDALALRGHLAPTAFNGRAYPESAPPIDARGSADAWLEAEIVRHLDLLVGMPVPHRRTAAADTIRILRGPVRALTAWSGAGDAGELLRELASSLAAAGLAAEPTGTPPRPAWVRFLRLPALAPVADASPVVRRRLDVPAGVLDGSDVVVRDVAWSADVVEVRVARAGAMTPTPRRWLARVIDPVAGLHAGQPGAASGTDVVFRLRPGLQEVAPTMAITVVAGAEAADVEVVL